MPPRTRSATATRDTHSHPHSPSRSPPYSTSASPAPVTSQTPDPDHDVPSTRASPGPFPVPPTSQHGPALFSSHTRIPVSRQASTSPLVRHAALPISIPLPPTLIHASTTLFNALRVLAELAPRLVTLVAAVALLRMCVHIVAMHGLAALGPLMLGMAVFVAGVTAVVVGLGTWLAAVLAFGVFYGPVAVGLSMFVALVGLMR